ncbi:hypothetical protein QQF64_016047 [Cirrhinus molitorella]|uniref:Uncharacterized protein n=1 Tax=Cirrhinus molitorella TaxID=172907 RepID=A0ABR3LQU9_9TELE
MFTSSVALREVFLPYLLISPRNLQPVNTFSMYEHLPTTQRWSGFVISNVKNSVSNPLPCVCLSTDRPLLKPPPALRATARSRYHRAAPQSLHRPLSVVMATRRLTSSLCHSHMLMQSLRNNLHYSSV